MSSTPPKVHFVFTALPAWGHNRPFCILAARLAKENKNFVATLLLPPMFLNIAQADVTAEFGKDAPEELRQRVRILSTVPATSPPDVFALAPLHAQAFESFYRSLTQEKPISCAITATTFDAVSAPAVVVADFFALPQIMATRAITGDKVPIISWVTGHPHEGSFLVHNGTNDQSVYHTKPRGEIIKIDGVPDMYDWERSPQKLPFELPSDIIKTVYHGLKSCDASFFTSAYALQKETIDTLKVFFTEDWKQQLYVIGPLLPSGYGEASNNTERSAEIQAFLDKTLVEKGENSVVLVSFGSIFWPTSPEYIEEVLEALLEKKVPFILSQASPFSVISEALVEKIKESGIGLLSKWVPQQFVLGHPATGWFVTHAGHNGVMESLGGGVPMICWPFGADQTGAAAHLSENLKVAFELVEVRTGEDGLKPMLRSGRSAKGTREAVGVEIREVLDACSGPKGKELRANAKRVQAELAQAWETDGVSRKEFNAFLEKYGIELS